MAKNPDYSESAEKLHNHEETLKALTAYHDTADDLKELQEQAAKLIPTELKEDIRVKTVALAVQDKAVRAAIEKYGSYQNLDTGWYAVKQRKNHFEYVVEKVRTFLRPDLVKLVIVESVDGTRMNGLIKGEFITKTQAEQCGTKSTDYAFIIR